ncbi:MAG: nitroreductase family protein [Candidatus Aenigmarchaeota archaeon]|nr:nitroreductase family protein [Candidatus Aenigmarchaeota archaeon]
MKNVDMDFEDVVKQRRSVRSYDTERQVSDEQLKKLFELVKLSPSSYNLQPWEFIVVKDVENKRRLKDCAQGQKHVEECSAAVIVIADTNPMSHADDIFEDRLKRGYYTAEQKERNLNKVRELAKKSFEERRVWAVRSTSLACMTLMLAAKDMGLSTCPMEGFDAGCVKKEFKIPDGYEIVMLITLGYEKNRPLPRLKRYGFDDFVHFEKYEKK